MKKLIAIWLILTLSGIVAFAQEKPPKGFEELFRAGLTAYQTKVYDQSKELFLQALQAEPRNTAAMVNLGLCYFQLNDKGSAIGWFRRALVLQPDNDTARAALKFAVSKLEVKEIPHRIETYETLRENILQQMSIRNLLSLTALLILCGGWMLLNWLGAQKRALKSADIPPAFPVSTGTLVLFAVISAVILGLKFYDSTLPRGTVTGPKIEAKSAPGESGVVLFELHEGFEVLIRELQNDWVQVTYPGGLTGWIPKANLILSE